MIRLGVDMLHHNADQAALGLFQAVKESPGVFAFGANADQSALAPDRVLGSVVIDLPRAFLAIAREVKSGNFTPKVETFGLSRRRDALRSEPAAGGDRVPAALAARVKAASGLDHRGNAEALSRQQATGNRQQTAPVPGASRYPSGMTGLLCRRSAVPLATSPGTSTSISGSARSPTRPNALNGLQAENRSGLVVARSWRRWMPRWPPSRRRAACDGSPCLLPGAPRALLGRQRPADRPTVPEGPRAARKRHRALFRPHSARRPRRSRQQLRAGPQARARRSRILRPVSRRSARRPGTAG